MKEGVSTEVEGGGDLLCIIWLPRGVCEARACFPVIQRKKHQSETLSISAFPKTKKSCTHTHTNTNTQTQTHTFARALCHVNALHLHTAWRWSRRRIPVRAKQRQPVPRTVLVQTTVTLTPQRTRAAAMAVVLPAVGEMRGMWKRVSTCLDLDCLSAGSSAGAHANASLRSCKASVSCAQQLIHTQERERETRTHIQPQQLTHTHTAKVFARTLTDTCESHRLLLDGGTSSNAQFSLWRCEEWRGTRAMHLQSV